MANRKLWTPEEDQVILKLIEQHGTNQWTVIAAEMKVALTSSRTSKQIRQRWYNQLCPSITKTPWSRREEDELFTAHSRLGNKWKQIAGLLNGRTDNSVKNHFYSTIRRALRRLDKNFGYRDSTRKMRNLKPSALTYFLQTAQHMEIYSDMMDLILQFAQWKPTRQNKLEPKEEPKIIYEKILDILNNFKENKEQIETRNRATSHQVDILEIVENYSTESGQISLHVGQEENNDEIEEFNYFGSEIEVRSWFNMNQKQQQLICDKRLSILCDDEQE